MNVTHEEDYYLSKILMVSCYCITFIVGIIGNGLVIWISGFKMRTVSAVWFLNLAIADFIFCLSLPVRVIDWLLISQYFSHIGSLHLFLVNFNYLMLAVNSVVSVTFLTVISVHRCVSIMWPFWAKVHWTRRLSRIASVFLWLVPLTSAVLIHVIFIFNSVITRNFLLVVPNPSNVLFIDDFDGPRDQITFMLTINSVLTFGTPFTIILICNGLIIYKLRSNKFKKPKTFQRTFKLIIAVVVCFFLCWFPFNIWPFIAIQLNMLGSLEDFMISSFCLCLVSISSCINPILYVLLGHTCGYKSRKSIRARLEKAISDFK